MVSVFYKIRLREEITFYISLLPLQWKSTDHLIEDTIDINMIIALILVRR